MKYPDEIVYCHYYLSACTVYVEWMINWCGLNGRSSFLKEYLTVMD